MLELTGVRGYITYNTLPPADLLKSFGDFFDTIRETYNKTDVLSDNLICDEKKLVNILDKLSNCILAGSIGAETADGFTWIYVFDETGFFWKNISKPFPVIDQIVNLFENFLEEKGIDVSNSGKDEDDHNTLCDSDRTMLSSGIEEIFLRWNITA